MIMPALCAHLDIADAAGSLYALVQLHPRVVSYPHCRLEVLLTARQQ